MSKVLLADVLQSPKDFGYTGDINLRQIAYEYTRESYILQARATGYYKDQLFESKKKHTWYSFLYDGKAVITTGEVTDFILSLKGNAGYQNGVSCLRDIIEMHLSDMTEVAKLNENMYRAMPKTIREKCYNYWLMEKYEDENEGSYCDFGLKSAVWGGVQENTLFYYYDYYKYGSPDSNTCFNAVRPTLHLKSGVRIDLDQLLHTKGPVTPSYAKN